MILDTRTLIINSAIISFVMTVAMLMTWRISRDQRSALFWTLAMFGNCAGLVIYATTIGVTPLWVPPMGNIPFAISGMAMGLGLRAFRQVPLRPLWGAILPAYYIGGIFYFLFVQEDFGARVIVASIFQIGIGLVLTREAFLVRKVGLAGGAATAVSVLFAGHAIYYTLRLISMLGLAPVPDLLAPSAWQTYTFLESGLIILSTGVALMAMTVDNLYLQLRMTALSDRTTGLLSRNALLEKLNEAIEAAKAGLQPLHLMMIDLDHLDRVNETYGHKAGDAMLAAFGSLIRNEFRLEKNSGRYGGDEFALVLAGMTAAEATNLAHQIRRATEALILPLENGRVSLTVSIGLAGLQHQDQQFDTLIARADTALYRAKQTGRNRVVVL